MVRAGLAVVSVLLVVGWTAPAASAATCDDYSNQAQAQRAKDTRDADGDGIYCESLPCPCLKPRDSGGGGGGGSPTPAPKPESSCVRPQGVLRLVFTRAKYPNIRRHFIAAVKKGWPRVMVFNRKGADERRDRLLEGFPTRPGLDRDEYPLLSGGASRTATSAAWCAGSTRWAGWPTWRTSRAVRTARTARRLGRSSAGSETAPDSRTPSYDGGEVNRTAPRPGDRLIRRGGRRRGHSVPAPPATSCVCSTP
jgi:hypothetical protein